MEFNKKKIPIYLILTVFLFMGFFTFSHYGVSWDEGAQRVTGVLNYKYVFEGNDALLSYNDKDYGVAFELPLTIIENTFGITEFRSIYLMRHLVSHFFFLFAAFIFYRLILLIFKKQSLAILGMLMLLLMPRLYAHSFFNTKDLPFLSMFIISFYLLARVFNKKTYLNTILLAISLGLLINIRLMGVLLLVVTLFFFFVDALHLRKYKQNFWIGVTLILVCSLSLYSTWPYLWVNPFENFVIAFSNMSKFRWDGTMLFKGEVIHGVDVKANYIPTWIGISTPIGYLILSLFGLGFFLLTLIKKPTKYLFEFQHRMALISFLTAYASVFIVIALSSVLYDGWRQLYYIYPWIIFLGLFFMNNFWEKDWFRMSCITILSVSFGITSFFMINNRPVMQSYFNPLMSMGSEGSISQQYEMDYWGASYKQLFETLAEEKGSVKVFADKGPAKENLKILEKSMIKKIELVDKLEDAMYFVTIYRNVYSRYPEMEPFLYKELKVHDNRVAAIYKLN